MVADLAIVVGGALMILILAEIVIAQTLAIASHFNLSGSFVGLTILSIGTSLLEIVTHVIGSIQILRAPESLTPLSGLLIGSNIGSDIFQQNFVLPLVGLLGTVVVVRRLLLVEVGGLVGASCLLWLVCWGGNVSRLEGVLLVLTYIAYLVYVGSVGAHGHEPARLRRLSPARRAFAVFALVAGFAGMAWVAGPVLASASALVALLPLSASFFGVVVLGIAAALPELMTALVSIAKGQREISAGILIGSNITNPLFGVGLGAMISTYRAPTVTVYYDLPIKIGTALLLYAFLARKKDLSRNASFVLMLAYFLYVVARPVFFAEDVAQ